MIYRCPFTVVLCAVISSKLFPEYEYHLVLKISFTLFVVLLPKITIVRSYNLVLGYLLYKSYILIALGYGSFLLPDECKIVVKLIAIPACPVKPLEDVFLVTKISPL